ncbi:MAG: hypothetical protein JNM99_07305 [Verrucomicrobiaceae bacterium]|nr:hypothetical protein [Verrucomicrobiaceae bacterium]
MNPDYADWLNPMLVKELRQGLRKSVFVSVFLLVQIAMVILIGFRMLSAASGADQMVGGFLDGVLWTGLGLALLIIMPMRGLASITEEQKANTLDLVQMTRMGSTGIVLGKWVAVMSQSLLIAVAVLPYAVLRYFFGGVDVVENLITLTAMILGSAAATALCLWLSTMPAAARGIGVGLAIYLIPSLLVGSRMAPVFGMSSVANGSVFVWIYATIIMTIFLLELAASRIAPIAENHATRIRLIAVVGVVIALLGSAMGATEWAVPRVILLLWASFEALTELTSEVPSLYAPWASRGPVTRMVARTLYPGWATGLLFTLAMMTVMIGNQMLFLPHPRSEQWQPLIEGLIFWFALIAPVAVLVLMPGVKFRGAIYFLVHLLCAFFFIVARTINGSRSVATSLIDSLTPTSAAMAVMGGLTSSDNHWPFFTILTLPIGGCIAVFLFIRARKEFRLIREMEGRALAPESAALTSDA